MNIFKKTVALLLIASMSVTAVGCGKKKEAPKKSTTTITTEYITEITKENVDQIVGEYKDVLNYYNELKNNLKIIKDVSKNSDLEKDLSSAKESIKSNEELLKKLDLQYKPLHDAKLLLLKMYKVSSEMADVVTTDSNAYSEKSDEYSKLFEEFKQMMDTIRKDIEAVRGVSPTKEENKDKTDENSSTEDNSGNSSKEDNSNSDISSNDNSGSSSDRESSNSGGSRYNNDDNSGSRNSSSGSSGSGSSSSKNNSGNSGSSGSNNSNNNNNNTYDPNVPKVSSLNNSIRSAIRNAGTSSGARFKQNGGTPDQLEKIAVQTFYDIEGDNPIDKNQLAEARQIFVNAFKKAYYGN